MLKVKFKKQSYGEMINNFEGGITLVLPVKYEKYRNSILEDMNRIKDETNINEVLDKFQDIYDALKLSEIIGEE